MRDVSVQQEVDVENFISSKVSSEYPCFVFSEGNDPFVVVYGNLREGEIPLIIDNGKIRKMFPKRISGSVYNVQQLLQVLKFMDYYNEKGECFKLSSILDYVEAVMV